MASTQATESRAGERRRATRRQPALGTMIRLDDGPATTPHVGLVWNISSSGVSFLAHEPLQQGRTFSGQLATMDNADALPITLHVAHTRKLATGDYVLGAQFERTLSTADLEPFLGERQ